VENCGLLFSCSDAGRTGCLVLALAKHGRCGEGLSLPFIRDFTRSPPVRHLRTERRADCTTTFHRRRTSSAHVHSGPANNADSFTRGDTRGAANFIQRSSRTLSDVHPGRTRRVFPRHARHLYFCFMPSASLATHRYTFALVLTAIRRHLAYVGRLLLQNHKRRRTTARISPFSVIHSFVLLVARTRHSIFGRLLAVWTWFNNAGNCGTPFGLRGWRYATHTYQILPPHSQHRFRTHTRAPLPPFHYRPT